MGTKKYKVFYYSGLENRRWEERSGYIEAESSDEAIAAYMQYVVDQFKGVGDRIIKLNNYTIKLIPANERNMAWIFYGFRAIEEGDANDKN